VGTVTHTTKPSLTPNLAIQFHIETFGSEVLPGDSPVLEAFITEATIPD
jgi:hypothetical protein